ncbi:cystathionine gamma-synthase [Natronospira proteinivora]|uniref:Cystathionine gamma-synthase n=1 Tax=Natronospira proteinivora TaxID=1807133 RepID=A0ABT1G8Z0_9GAMM|nr:cystathionine gamma-synthase [Natronospira proteinivora]MCP1727789.1 cystathionine gamma-synthase [Natronospira proteinivora]
MPRPESQPQTISVRTGVDSDSQYGGVIPPIHMSSTFSFAGFGEARAHDYSRSGNPTRDRLADALRDLEGGVAATVTATGMAAITTVLQLLGPEDRILATHDCYGGTFRLLDAWAEKGAFKLDFVDFNDPDATRQALSQGPKLVWLETPSNPLLRITDIQRVAEQARAAGARVVVDNTFLSPVLQRPLDLGADIVVHSTTKYINGHSDVIGGAIISGDPELGETIAWWANCLGVTASAMDCWLTLRGLRTLHARLRLHQENAVNVCEFLSEHPAVKTVHYPGLASHPGHLIARRQQNGFGAMLSFELNGGEAQVREFLSRLRCITLAESLGGVESLIAHPATMTHAAMHPDARQRAGIGDGLLRLSVGIESPGDLIADLDQALSGLAQPTAFEGGLS